MVHITPAAGSRLSDKLVDLSDGVAVRIVIRDGRKQLCPGRLRPGDETYQYAGRTVLLLAKDVAKYLDKGTIDVRHTSDGPQLRYFRP